MTFSGQVEHGPVWGGVAGPGGGARSLDMGSLEVEVVVVTVCQVEQSTLVQGHRHAGQVGTELKAGLRYQG